MRKTFIILFLIIVCAIPIFSQSMTIDKDKLADVIKTEIQKQINDAVDKAVAIAVKAEDEKYVQQLADKDVIIAQKDGQIQKDLVQHQQDIVNNENETIKLDNYKKAHGLKHDLIQIGISFGAGIITGYISHK